MKILFIIFVIVLDISQQSMGCLLGPRIHVNIMNNLDPNSPELGLHCQSKNDDLGYHTLPVNQFYYWTFCENFTTLFHCRLYLGELKEVGFEAYAENIFKVTKKAHYWSVRNDAIYYSTTNITSHFVPKYYWSIQPHIPPPPSNHVF
ncbi:hypothetical protein PHJA_002500000 [Phtheirospermum japonicum]|uniref:S-protein homolog n=1 Tax=Phtheirospermum japonicum TaxID=374723 RepID=A0A830DB56_9LAMI|nr:hypothetical protein PHJA_002500000 [Phtheirospermum japonicum]